MSLFTERLMGSQAKAKLLRMLLKNPSTQFHLRGLCRLANVPSSNALKSLTALKEMGLITIAQGPRGAVYQLNNRHEAVPHLFHIFMADDVIVRSLADAVWKLPIQEAFIFGSYAKATATETSDIDVMLVADNLSNLTANAHLRPIARNLGKTISVNVVKPELFAEQKSHPDDFWKDVLAHTLTLRPSSDEKH